MLGVCPCAGEGKRLGMLTRGVQKCLLPVYDKPVAWYALRRLKLLGCDRAAVIVRQQDRMAFQRTFGGGGDGLPAICFVEQWPTLLQQDRGEGMFYAIAAAQGLLDGEPGVWVVPGDNVTTLSVPEAGGDRAATALLKVSACGRFNRYTDGRFEEKPPDNGPAAAAVAPFYWPADCLAEWQARVDSDAPPTTSDMLNFYAEAGRLAVPEPSETWRPLPLMQVVRPDEPIPPLFYDIGVVPALLDAGNAIHCWGFP